MPVNSSQLKPPDYFGDISPIKEIAGKYLLSLNSKVIFKSMKVADDTFYRNSECEWVKVSVYGYKARHHGSGLLLICSLSINQ